MKKGLGLKFKVYSHRLTVLFAMIFLMFSASKFAFAEAKKESADHLVIFFDHPEMESDLRTNTFNFQFFSQNSIFVGNQVQVKFFENILDNIVRDKIASQGIVSSLATQIRFYDSEGYVKNLYIDKNKNFEFGRIKGKISDAHYKELIGRCMEFVKIIDLRFQKSVVWRTRVRELCGKDDIEPCR